MLLSALAWGGCATDDPITETLWDGRMEACNVPAPDTRLRLYQDDRHNDLLVVYQEFRERNDSIHTRAFLLHRNEQRLTANQRPQFIRKISTAGLYEVPVYWATNVVATDLPKTLCALVRADGRQFTLYSGGQATGTHDLPTYDDGKGRWECVALTPAAVAVDATVVGAVVASYCGYWWVSGNPDIPIHGK
jgi:hypothetical protein